MLKLNMYFQNIFKLTMQQVISNITCWKLMNPKLHLTYIKGQPFKIWGRTQRKLREKMQLDVGVSPPANIMTFRPGLTHLTIDLDPRDH